MATEHYAPSNKVLRLEFSAQVIPLRKQNVTKFVPLCSRDDSPQMLIGWAPEITWMQCLVAVPGCSVLLQCLGVVSEICRNQI
jgi:hypothetical protein